jgi:RNA polymerase sigma factor (sigma-70 family)
MLPTTSAPDGAAQPRPGNDSGVEGSDAHGDVPFALLSDHALLNLTRQGDAEAFGLLWRRYYAMAVAVAARFADASPEDIAAEAFTAVLGAIRGGRGPTEGFSSYLYTTVRRVAANARGNLALREWDEEATRSDADTEGTAMANFDRERIRAVFYAMDERSRRALWLADGLGLSRGEIARTLGLGATHASVVVQRARRQFARLWIVSLSDLKSVPADGEHAAVLATIPALLAGTLSKAKTAKTEAHLAGCPSCREQVGQLQAVTAGSARVLLASLLGAVDGRGAAQAVKAVVAPPSDPPTAAT